ncbi:MAG TPA: hypothetical protein VG032_12345 [Acidimicrobiales bacterium]|nr:hypothetical protein [Acidimicrobiales bacterium]
MCALVAAILVGVKDLARSKRFYQEGLGCPIEQDLANVVELDPVRDPRVLQATRTATTGLS